MLSKLFLHFRSFFHFISTINIIQPIINFASVINKIRTGAHFKSANALDKLVYLQSLAASVSYIKPLTAYFGLGSCLSTWVICLLASLRLCLNRAS